LPESFTIAVDRDGLVIYFAVNGRRFLFNGNNGAFYDSLPDYAVEILEILRKQKDHWASAFAAAYMKHGRSGIGLLEEIRQYRYGTHPGLTPEKRRDQFPEEPMPSAFNVYMAQACNLRCRYCFNQQGTFGQTPLFMSEQTARSLLALITRSVRSGRHRVIGVNLFGGEPLLAPRAVYVLARGLQDLNHQDLPARVHLMLSTNGTIYSKEIFDIIAERPDLSAVIVSLDGFKNTHDRNRPFANPRLGSGYDAVLHNLRRMMREKIPYSVTCVVPYPHDYIGAAEALHRLGVRRLEIKELIRHVYGRTSLAGLFRRDFPLWKKRYLAYTDYYIDYLPSRNPVPHSNRFNMIGDYARALGKPAADRRTLACGLASEKVGVTSDGRLIPCESFLGHDAFEIGNVERGLDSSKFERFEEWIFSRGQHRIEHKRCRTCYTKLICGGGCYALSYDRTRRLHPLPEASCKYVRETTKIDLYYISRMRKEHPGIYAKITGAPAPD